jgi:hypothetical protein
VNKYTKESPDLAQQRLISRIYDGEFAILLLFLYFLIGQG